MSVSDIFGESIASVWVNGSDILTLATEADENISLREDGGLSGLEVYTNVQSMTRE